MLTTECMLKMLLIPALWVLSLVGPDPSLMVAQTVSDYSDGEIIFRGSSLVNGARFNAAGTLIAAAFPRSMELIDVASRLSVGTLANPYPGGGIHRPEFDRSGERLLAGSTVARAMIWDVQARTEHSIVRQASMQVLASVHFSPDGRHVVMASFDSTIKTFDGTVNDVYPMDGAAYFAYDFRLANLYTIGRGVIQFNVVGRRNCAAGFDRERYTRTYQRGPRFEVRIPSGMLPVFNSMAITRLPLVMP